MTHGRPPWWVAGWCVLLAVIILGPALGPGFALSYDMVAVPEQRLVPSAWGGASALPRAVPQDALVAVVDTIVPGDLLQKLVLAVILVAAGVGAAVLLARTGVGPGPQIVGATVFMWSPYVAERLVLGHVGLLACYAVLPWLIDAARRLRAGGGRRAVAAIVLCVAAASVTPTGGLIATVIAVVMVTLPRGRHGRRHSVAAAAGALLLQLPWLVPSLFHASDATSDPAGVAAFAARADGPLGLVGSVATLGGIWNADAVPDSRGLWSSAVLAVAILVVAAFGYGRLAPGLGRAATATLTAAAVAGLVIAVAGAAAPTADLVAWVVAEVPGGGLVRDGQKFLAPYALLVAVAAGLGANRLARRVLPAPVSRLVVGVAILLPVAAMPDLAWGVAGRVSATAYPDAWAQVRVAVDEESPPGDLVILPFQPFRAFPWTDGRVVLDPAPRFLGRETVVPGDLTVGDRTVRGEDERAAAVGGALEEGDLRSLADLGIGAVVVERDTPGRVPEDLVARLDPIVITGVLDAYRVPGPVAARPSPVPVAAVVAGWTAALAVVLTAVTSLLVGHRIGARLAAVDRGRTRSGGTA